MQLLAMPGLFPRARYLFCPSGHLPDFQRSFAHALTKKTVPLLISVLVLFSLLSPIEDVYMDASFMSSA